MLRILCLIGLLVVPSVLLGAPVPVSVTVYPPINFTCGADWEEVRTEFECFNVPRKHFPEGSVPLEEICYFGVGINFQDHSEWWYSAAGKERVCVSGRCEGGPWYNQYRAGLDGWLYIKTVPAGLTDQERLDSGCTNTFPDIYFVLCTKEPEKAQDCYQSGGNCVHLIDSGSFTCTNDPAVVSKYQSEVCPREKRNAVVLKNHARCMR